MTRWPLAEAWPQFVIYWSPSDHPDCYVVRRWYALPSGAVPDTAYLLAPTLEDARALIPDHMTCLQRTENDDPVIVETWI